MRALVDLNLAALERIVHWNAQHHVQLFRVGQQLVPFASHPSFPYDWEETHGDELRRIGALAGRCGVRLSIHPGQYIQPASPTPDVAARSIEELRYSARLIHLLAPEDGVVVLHLGGGYDDHAAAADRFLERLAPHGDLLTHLALENDERIWTVQEVVTVAQRLGVPALVDAFHHRLNPGTLSLRDALAAALPTWRTRPKVHLSSQDPARHRGAHAYGVTLHDWAELLDALPTAVVDVMIEAKGKERAVLQLRDEWDAPNGV